MGQVIERERRRQGWTQTDIARHLGVTKAAVSKWETGQSYPDTAILPRLAALFAISLDELMAYTPVMPKAQIRLLYRRLAADFLARPFEEVMAECRLIVKQYYGCFELLYFMGLLMLNHHMLPGDAGLSSDVIQEARTLFIRVKTHSEDAALAHQALHMEALCCLALDQPREAVGLLEQIKTELIEPESLLASACRLAGDSPRASRVLQTSIYRHVVGLVGNMTAYLELSARDEARFDETLKRVLNLIEGFHLDSLHPGLLFSFYLIAAQGQMGLGRGEEALRMLEKYADLATRDVYPLKLRADAYFDGIEEWLEETLPLGNAAPREEKSIRRDMTRAVADHPAFAGLQEEPRYQNILRRLKENEE